MLKVSSNKDCKAIGRRHVRFRSLNFVLICAQSALCRSRLLVHAWLGNNSSRVLIATRIRKRVKQNRLFHVLTLAKHLVVSLSKSSGNRFSGAIFPRRSEKYLESTRNVYSLIFDRGNLT